MIKCRKCYFTMGIKKLQLVAIVTGKFAIVTAEVDMFSHFKPCFISQKVVMETERVAMVTYPPGGVLCLHMSSTSPQISLKLCIVFCCAPIEYRIEFNYFVIKIMFLFLIHFKPSKSIFHSLVIRSNFIFCYHINKFMG